MRVLSVGIGYRNLVGGAPLRMLRISSELLRAGVDLHLALLDRGFEDGELQAEFSIPPERTSRIRCWNARFNISEPALRQLGRLVDGTDLVFASSFLWGVAPVVCRLARARGVPWVVTPGGVLPYFGRSIGLKKAAHAWYGARMLREARFLIAVTDLEARALAPHAGSGDRVVVVPNGISVGEVLRRPEPRQRVDGAAPAVFVGRLEEVKGVDLLLRALASLDGRTGRPPRMVIAGTGPERRSLEALAARLGLSDRVDFRGYVDEATKLRLLDDAAFVVIPSRRDAMTQVVLEAAAAARPVLMTSACGFAAAQACGGAIEVEADERGLEAGLEAMLAAEPEWPAMGASLRALALREYSWERIGRLHLEFFEKALGR